MMKIGAQNIILKTQFKSIMNISFKNKIVLITGATRGIGKTLCDELHNLGAFLLLTGTDKKEIDELNKNALIKKEFKKYFCVDFTNKESLDTFLKELSSFSKIDCLVNNAGINILHSIDSVNNKNWNDMLSVNLTAPLLITSLISKKMIENKFGRIVNIGSIFGSISKPKRVCYTATKYGIHGITVGTTVDLAKYDILSNTISPGFVMTDLTKKNLSALEIDELKSKIPIGRFAETFDITKPIIFLLSTFNTYITGQNIIIDGGYTNV